MKQEKLCPKKVGKTKELAEDIKTYLIPSKCPYTTILLEKISKIEKIDLNHCDCDNPPTIPPKPIITWCPRKLKDIQLVTDDVMSYLIQGKCPYNIPLIQRIREAEKIDYTICHCDHNC